MPVGAGGEVVTSSKRLSSLVAGGDVTSSNKDEASESPNNEAKESRFASFVGGGFVFGGPLELDPNRS